MDWVSVSDRLPEKSYDPVLLATKDGEVYSGYFDFHKRACVGVSFLDDVTHWMPYPEPPKK